jgi:hypothetical protein
MAAGDAAQRLRCAMMTDNFAHELVALPALPPALAPARPPPLLHGSIVLDALVAQLHQEVRPGCAPACDVANVGYRPTWGWSRCARGTMALAQRWRCRVWVRGWTWGPPRPASSPATPPPVAASSDSL